MSADRQPWPEVMGNLSTEHADVRALLSDVAAAARQGDAATAARHIDAGRSLLADSLDEHIRVEDDELFPAIAEALGEGLVGVFAEEHGEIIRLRDAVLTDAPAFPLTACLELCDMLESHTLREDQMLFPAAREALGG